MASGGMSTPTAAAAVAAGTSRTPPAAADGRPPSSSPTLAQTNTRRSTPLDPAAIATMQQALDTGLTKCPTGEALKTMAKVRLFRPREAAGRGSPEQHCCTTRRVRRGMFGL